MKGDMAVRSITASISPWMARSAPRTICSVTGSHRVATVFDESCAICLFRPQRRSAAGDSARTLPQDASSQDTLPPPTDERGILRAGLQWHDERRGVHVG